MVAAAWALEASEEAHGVAAEVQPLAEMPTLPRAKLKKAQSERTILRRSIKLRKQFDFMIVFVHSVLS